LVIIRYFIFNYSRFSFFLRCGHCKTLIPAYAAAAKELSESGSGIVFASVDATNNQELAKEHGVKGYPTMKFFKNGTKIDYKAGRAQSDMIRWLKKKTGPPAAELNTVDDLNKLKESDDVVVIGAFKVVDFIFIQLFNVSLSIE
jgi:protein disulfide-isomerase A1